MARMLTARMADALKAGAQRIIIAEIDHPSGTFRSWTGIGTLSWNGYDWTGIGTLGKIDPIRMTTELGIQELRLSLSGVDSDTLALLEGSVRNREAVVWLGCLAEDGKVIADPWQMLTCQLDYQEFPVDEAGQAMVVIIARAGFYTLERATDETWSPENQKKLYPGDTGLDMLPSLQNQQVNWTAS